MGYDRGDSFPLNQMEFHLVQNRKENCHHDYIPFNVKGTGSLVFSVQGNLSPTFEKKGLQASSKIECFHLIESIH